MEKKLSVGQNALLNSIGSLFYLGCQWLITVLVIRIGSVEDGGDLSLAMSITNIFYTLDAFGMREFQVSDYHNKHSTSDYITTRIMTCLFSILLCSAVILPNRHYSGTQMACILIYMLFRACEALIDTFQAIEQKADRMDYTCISFVVRGILLLGGFSAILRITHQLPLAILGIALFSLAVLFLFDWPAARRLTGFKLHFSLKCSALLLVECVPLMCNSLLQTAVVSIPRTALESLYGNYTLGIYASIATPATIVQSAATWLYTPTITVFTRNYIEKNKKAYFSLLVKILSLLAAVFAAILAGAALLGHWGLNLLFGGEIAEYSSLLIPVLLTTLLIALSYFFGALLTITRKLKVLLVANAAAAVLTLALSRPLIRTFGMSGVNYVIYIAMGVNALILLIALLLILNTHFNQPAAQK